MTTQAEILAAAQAITPEQVVRCIQLLRFQADGCSFINSRAFAGGDCAQENGRGFDCPSCAAGKLLKELGLKTHEEEWKERLGKKRRP